MLLSGYLPEIDLLIFYTSSLKHIFWMHHTQAMTGLLLQYLMSQRDLAALADYILKRVDMF